MCRHCFSEPSVLQRDLRLTVAVLVDSGDADIGWQRDGCACEIGTAWPYTAGIGLCT